MAIHDSNEFPTAIPMFSISSNTTALILTLMFACVRLSDVIKQAILQTNARCWRITRQCTLTIPLYELQNSLLTFTYRLVTGVLNYSTFIVVVFHELIKARRSTRYCGRLCFTWVTDLSTRSTRRCWLNVSTHSVLLISSRRMSWRRMLSPTRASAAGAS